MKVAFFDRDGTIIEDYPDHKWTHIKDPVFLADSIETLKGVNQRGYEIIIITNQYLLNEGFISIEQYKDITEKMMDVLTRQGVKILDIFYCPHSRTEGCNCIKPRTGMIAEAMKKIFDKLQREILKFIEEAQRVGVNMISYADSSGGLNILGPKLSEEVVEMFTYPFLKGLEELLNDETIVLLCPKTTFALLGTDKVICKEIDLGAPMKYWEGCIDAIGQVKFVGEMCIKNKGFVLKNGIIKGIQLL